MNHCPKCGFEVKDMKFCPKCGFELQASPSEDPLDNDTIEDSLEEENSPNSEAPEQCIGMAEMCDYRSELLGTNAEHYLPIFVGMSEKDHASWNWCAFLFGPMWFAYGGLECLGGRTPGSECINRILV